MLDFLNAYVVASLVEWEGWGM